MAPEPTPEAWVAVLTATSTAIGVGLRYAWEQRRNGNGHGSRVEERLRKVEHEVLDANGTVRTRFHSLANDVNKAWLQSEINKRRLDSLESLGPEIKGQLARIEGGLSEVREDVAFLKGQASQSGGL